MQLCVVVTPRAGKDALAGWRENAAGERELLVQVTAAPQDGKATAAVCKVVAASLGIPKSCVRCARGETSRHKRLEVDCAPEKFAEWVAQQ